LGRYLRADPLDIGSITVQDLPIRTFYELSTNGKSPFFLFSARLVSKILNNPIESNSYLYANDNPLINVDPLGLSSKNVLKWMKRLKACNECKKAINNPEGDDWDAFTRCRKCCRPLMPRSYFSVTPCEQACVKLWKEKHGK
jgi:hypothetical protein